MPATIYNCKRCKTGLRVEYPEKGITGWWRDDADGNSYCAGIWLERSGGDKPPVYGGDPLGVCKGCNRMMTYGQLKASVREDVRCDARCTGARGHSCDCSCGGSNHGAGWMGGVGPFHAEAA